MPENQTAWNFDNQRVKETFMQTGRRGRDWKPGAEDVQQGNRPCRRGGGWRTRWFHIFALISRRNNWGARHTTKPRVSAWETKDWKPMVVKACGVCEGGRNSQSHRRVCWRGSQGPRRYTNPHTRESAPERAQTVGSQGSDRKWGKSWASGIVPSQTPSPIDSVTAQQRGLAQPSEHLRLCPFLHNSYTKTKNMAQRKNRSMLQKKYN